MKKAFTLSETLIVIVVLGIVATLTIPALINKQKESVAKTKVKKAMAAYESAINKMIIENDLKSNNALNTWAGATANCGNPSNYFKKVQGDGCIFKTSDGIWWNISDIERPLIAFNQDNLTIAKANAENDYSAFVLVGRFGTDGSLRVDDLAYETANSETVNNYKSYDQVAKLYNFLSGKKSSGTETASCDEDDIFCEYKNRTVFPNCDNVDWSVTCNVCDENYPNPDGSYGCIIFADDGADAIWYTISFDNNGNKYKSEETLDSSDSWEVRQWALDTNGNVYKSYESVHFYNNRETDDDDTDCETYYNPDGSIQSQEGDGCE